VSFSFGPDGSLAVAALAEQWNGSTWSVMQVPQPAGKAAPAFTAVSCVTSSDCFAVGYSIRPRFWATLVERLQGSTWAIVKSPNPAGAGLAALGGVACMSARACWAVGERQKTPGAFTSRTLAERWNGTHWSIVPTP
jgi:hypothetical protein